MSGVKVDESGECMVLLVDGGRPVILVGPASDPDSVEMLWIGPRFFRNRSALRFGKHEFFRLYLHRYGFHHPEDPHASPEMILPASVAVLKSDDQGEPRVYTRTYDPDRAN